MRIVIATPVYYPMINGVAVFSHNLACGLAARGHEVLVITPSQNKKPHSESQDGVKISYLRSSTIKVYPDQIHPAEKTKKLFYKHGLKASILPARQIKKILDDFKPDVVHVQGSDPIGLAVVSYARKKHVPVVATEHNQPEVLTEPLHIPGMIRKPINSVLSAYFSNRQGKSDYATMPTQLAIDNLNHGKKKKIPVEAVSNGVDLSVFRSGRPTDAIYNIYNIPKGVPILLYVGRVDPEKKIDVTIQAFAKFLDKHKLDNLSKTLFVVVGDGVDKIRLEKKARELGVDKSVRFLGKIMPPELYEIYRIGDVFVTASEIETQGIVLIEAAASGLPLIAVDAGAVAEVCRNNKNGFLLKPGDTDGIAMAMSVLLSDDELRKKMSDESIEIAKEHSLDRTIDRFIEIYEKVTKRV